MIDNGVASEYTFREPTKEERQAVADHVDSISVDTSINFWDLQEQVKIYDAYYNKGVTDGYRQGRADIIKEVKSLLLEHTHYEYGDDITFMDSINFDIISEELDELIKEKNG